MTDSSVYGRAVVLLGAKIKRVKDTASLIIMTVDGTKIVVGVLRIEYYPA